MESSQNGIPPLDNRPFWRLVEAIMEASNTTTGLTDVRDVSLTSSAEVQALLSAAVEDDNAPLRSLITAITRAVNEDSDLLGVREVVLAFV